MWSLRYPASTLLRKYLFEYRNTTVHVLSIETNSLSLVIFESLCFSEISRSQSVIVRMIVSVPPACWLLQYLVRALKKSSNFRAWFVILGDLLFEDGSLSFVPGSCLRAALGSFSSYFSLVSFPVKYSLHHVGEVFLYIFNHHISYFLKPKGRHCIRICLLASLIHKCISI